MSFVRYERIGIMALELYMVGLVARNLDKSLEFYRRLGLAIPFMVIPLMVRLFNRHVQAFSSVSFFCRSWTQYIL